MPGHETPERNPVSDNFLGVVVEVKGKYLLSETPLPEGSVTLDGNFVLRYGIRYLGKPHLSIVPGLLVLDYGTILTGEEALYFALKKGDRYPRADVIGYRNDGQDEMIVMKKLDTALPLEVLAFQNLNDTKPVAGLTALIEFVPEINRNSIPKRVREHLPQFATLAEWKAEHNV